MDTAVGGKTPEADSDATVRIQASKPLSFSNGVLKRSHHAAFNNHQATVVGVVYKECLKNHAASLGAHAVDGCGEFMPSPTANSADPTSLKCAACGCHRNFHRREPEDAFPSSNVTATLEYRPHHRHHPPPPPPPPPPPLPHGDGGAHSSPSSPSPPPISSAYYPSAPHLLLTLSGGGMSAATTPQDHITPTGNRSGPAASQPNGRKRFRTRFTQDQKEKMQEFAGKLEWKMQKRDEELINGFCNEIGVEKGVFKVWMHNNKNISGKREHANAIPSTANTNSGAAAATTTTTTATNNVSCIEFVQQYHQNHESREENEGNNHFQDEIHHRHSDSFSGRVVAPNGSSSSS